MVTQGPPLVCPHPNFLTLFLVTGKTHVLLFVGHSLQSIRPLQVSLSWVICSTVLPGWKSLPFPIHSHWPSFWSPCLPDRPSSSQDSHFNVNATPFLLNSHNSLLSTFYFLSHYWIIRPFKTELSLYFSDTLHSTSLEPISHHQQFVACLNTSMSVATYSRTRSSHSPHFISLPLKLLSGTPQYISKSNHL